MAGRDDYLSLRYDWERRLRNALLALSQCDRQWMIWVEREINRRWGLKRITCLVEARARSLVLKQYSRLYTSELIFSNIPFSDEGNLLSG